MQKVLTTYLDITNSMKDKITSELIQATAAGDLDITEETRNKLIAVISSIITDVSANGYEVLNTVAKSTKE